MGRGGPLTRGRAAGGRLRPDRRLDRVPVAHPLRRLRRDVGAPVELRCAARCAQVGRRHLVDPAPRPGPRLCEAVERGGPHARALTGGAGGGGHRARGRRPGDRVVRVAFLGPAGTFTEEALRGSAPEGVDPVAYPTVYDTVMAVHEGQTDRALVPIENSLEGGVAATLDALATEASDVRIVAEHIHPIHHCLIAREELALGDISRVISHPQAMSQCGELLRGPLATAERVSSVSTAEAARTVAESTGSW